MAWIVKLVISGPRARNTAATSCRSPGPTTSPTWPPWAGPWPRASSSWLASSERSSPRRRGPTPRLVRSAAAASRPAGSRTTATTRSRRCSARSPSGCPASAVRRGPRPRPAWDGRPPCSGRTCRRTQAGPRDPAPPRIQGHRLRRRPGPARLAARSGLVLAVRGGSTRAEAGGPHRPGRPEDARDADGPAQPPRAQARAERRARPVARVGEGTAEPQSSSARLPAATATAPHPPAKSARDPATAEPSRPARRGGADAAWSGQYSGWSPRAAL